MKTMFMISRSAPLAAALLALLAVPAGAALAEGAEPSGPATVITSYGEINLELPTASGAEARADLRRFVIGLQHRFTAELKFVSEVEIEHAVSSAEDQGEVEVEQAYVERQLGATWAARAGLVLVPVGLLNERHEPTAYYGVERNFVETAIIPTTWREGAVQLLGTFENGLTVQAGVGTSFDLNAWDFGAESEGAESPLGSIHQELQVARAHDVGGFAAVDWRGLPGLLLGASGFLGGAGQGQPGAPDALVTLWEAHGRWQPGRFDLSGIFARGTLSNTAAWNQAHVGGTLIPEAFDGWYLQAAYRAWTHEDLALALFARLEQFNTGRSYAEVGQGLTPAARPTETVVTAGVSFYLSPEVVLKADYQRFDVDTARDRVDVGLGWSF